VAVKPAKGAEPDWRLDLVELGRWLKARPRPLALLCWNASAARDIVFACHETGLLVPEEVAVLSQADDEALCETSLIPISGIAVAGEGIGYQAAKILDALMAGQTPSPAAARIAPLGIVQRQSTDTLAVRDPILVKALSLVRQGATQPLHIDELARRAGVSRRMLERHFLDCLRCSPAAAIRRARIDHAQRLLLETDMPVLQVAEVAGFSSQGYFSTIFRRLRGITPLQYRKRNRIRPRVFQ
jgi:LacI family transcriptional regulator